MSKLLKNYVKITVETNVVKVKNNDKTAYKYVKPVKIMSKQQKTMSH